MKQLIPYAVCAMLLCPAMGVATGVTDPPSAANVSDPAVDEQWPASSQAVQFKSHSSSVNGLLYRPGGAGPHPVVVLLHGLPGNEQNLDLAQAIRRAGWAVVTFHYRGSWGSGGKFTLQGGIGDATALLALMRRSDVAKDWRIDPTRIAVVGHSYGGFIAARIAAEDTFLLGAALIAPWDISVDAATLAGLTPKQRAEKGAKWFADVDGRLSGADARSLAENIFSYGKTFSLAALAGPLSARRTLVVTADRDDPDDQAIDFLKNIAGHGGTPEVVRFATDHAFNDHRIALQAALLRWLSTLPGAPAAK